MYLNHDINAQRMTPTLSADTSEWDNNTDAIFVSGSSQAQTSVRLAHDDDYVYILGERLDNYVTDKDQIEFYINDGNGGQYTVYAYNSKIIVRHQTGNKSAPTTVDFESEGIKYRTTVCGTENDAKRKDTGIIYELAIPKKLIKISDDSVYFRVKMTNFDKDNEGYTLDDSNSSATLGSTKGWSKAILK